MRLYHRPRPQCWPCIIDISFAALERTKADEATKFELMREIVQTVGSELGQDTNLPALSTKIFRRISRVTGEPDPFRAEKEACNRVSLPIVERLSKGILSEKDALRRIVSAALASIAGNTMDLGTSGHSFDLGGFEDEYGRMVNQGLAVNDSQPFLDLLPKIGHLLYLADNAGEIAFDKILVEAISGLGPDVTVAVKGGPVSNDATIEDAEAVGMEKVAKVITTGTDHLGVNLEESSPEFLQSFGSADLIVSKGQSNLETLLFLKDRVRSPVLFVLRVKCQPIATTLGARLGDNVFRLYQPGGGDGSF